MIRAEFGQMEEMCLLSLEDHATGSPAVCAGASAIVYALAGWLRNHEPDELTIRLEPGEAWIWCRRDEMVDAAFGVAMAGLLQMAKKYPRYIRVEVNE